MNVSSVVPLTSVLHHCVRVHVSSTSLRLQQFNFRFGTQEFFDRWNETATRGSSRSSGPISSWNGTRHCPSLSSSPSCTGASVGQGETGWSRFLAGVQRELEGLVSGSNLPQPHLNMEEYWNQLAGAIRRAGQPFLQVPRKRLERLENTAAAL